MFQTESQKLEGLIDSARPDMNIQEIVKIYYQVINVSSMAVMLKQTDSKPDLLEKILETEKMISEKFDSDIHPAIRKRLSVMIQQSSENLQSESERTKEQIESDAKLFEELRQNMSTREFVEQYENELSHD